MVGRFKTDTQKIKKYIFRCFKICRPIGNLFQSFDCLDLTVDHTVLTFSHLAGSRKIYFLSHFDKCNVFVLRNCKHIRICRRRSKGTG